MALVSPVVAEEDPRWSLGEKLAKARRKAGLDQDQMAQRLGVSRPLISKWERDVSEPRASYLRAWASETGVRVEWLLTSGYKRDFSLVNGQGKGRRRTDRPLMASVTSR